MATQNNTPAKRRWYHNIADAYRITQRSFPWMKWALLGIFVVIFGGSLTWGIISGLWIYLPLLGLLLTLLAMMVLLSMYTKRASYLQIDGRPGAAAAVMQQVKGWNIESEPVGINPRTQDMLFRAVGRPGIVLVVEGPVSRTTRLVSEETRKLQRIVPNVVIHQLHIGDGKGQIKLAKLESAMRKLPKVLTKAEVAAVGKRLNSLGGMKLPIPKGIDPYRARPDRKGLRGR